ncbi:AlpA family phage regulatory protein [Mesosutterella sp. AGMB02718]|uniref:AlpA family phage regulatory protein n=1 Tax=Mesosutterella faecium TaxID=2925194 RepID=A0ABT7IMY6_9BURK|nr:AlpA family phage regulatory protein [Mesosutterella sp. AGMB02718]MDL2059251.1 AlpA family phage regulatory protein [Mesosutterella sp. AGMB02718]
METITIEPEAKEQVRLAARLKDVAAAVGLGRSTIRQYVSEGTFPKPFKVGTATLWYWDDVRKWLNEQAEKSRNTEA